MRYGYQARYWIDAHRQATPDFNAGLVQFTAGWGQPEGSECVNQSDLEPLQSGAVTPLPNAPGLGLTELREFGRRMRPSPQPRMALAPIENT